MYCVREKKIVRVHHLWMNEEQYYNRVRLLNSPFIRSSNHNVVTRTHIRFVD